MIVIGSVPVAFNCLFGAQLIHYSRILAGNGRCRLNYFPTFQLEIHPSIPENRRNVLVIIDINMYVATNREYLQERERERERERGGEQQQQQLKRRNMSIKSMGLPLGKLETKRGPVKGTKNVRKAPGKWQSAGGGRRLVTMLRHCGIKTPRLLGQ